MKLIILKFTPFYILFLIFLNGCRPPDSQPYVSLLPYYNPTSQTILSLSGTKTPGTAVMVNGQVISPFDSSSFWNGQIALAPGNNPVTVKSVNPFGNESPPVKTSVVLNTTPPSAPAPLPLPPQITTSPVLIQGTKDPNTSILLNGKEIVSYTAAPLWSYSYSPLQSSTSLAFSSKNRLGIESAKTSVTVTYTGPLPQPPVAPPLISPLDGESLKIVPAVFNSIRFTWTNTFAATYHIQISASPDFSSPVIDDPTIPSTPYLLNPSITPISPGIYYWRVGALDGSSNIFYSPSRKFRYGKILGDFNGDGYADILVGSEGGTGGVKIFFGGPFVPNLNPSLVLQGENGGDLFGTSIAIGDLNGDGYDDIIVGAYNNSAGGSTGGHGAGRVYIYFGGPSLHTTPDVILTGFSPGEQFGVSVASGGDINQDGYDDLLVGANLNGVKGTGTGRTYLFLGKPVLSTFPDLVLNGENPGDHFGISVSLAGDVNGDGFDDFLIGAGGDGSSTHTGKAYLYYGGYNPGSQPQLVFTGNSTGDFFGRMVSGVKDVNDDGFDDFLIGAPAHSSQTGFISAGEAYLYFGGPNLKTTPDLTYRGPNSASAYFGYSAAPLGDLPSKDGYADFIIGAYGGSTGPGSCITLNGGNCAGWAQVFKGGAAPSTVYYSQLSSGNTGSNESFGVSLSSAGDFNGDGFPDLIIGAFRADSSNGRAYYYDGSLLSSPSKTFPDRLLSGSTLEGFGIAVH